MKEFFFLSYCEYVAGFRLIKNMFLGSDIETTELQVKISEELTMKKVYIQFLWFLS